jgi:cytochrome P450
MGRQAASTVRPPGPRGSFLLGNAAEFRRDQLEFTTWLAAEYGEVASFRILNTDWCLVSNPELVYEILVSRAAEFVKPELNRKTLEMFTGDGLLTLNGDTWKRHLKLMMPGFHKQRIASYAAIMASATESMLSSWQPGQEIDFSAAMTDLTMEVVAKALFDADVRSEARSVGEAMRIINQVLVDHVDLPLPVPRWWPTPKNRRKIRAIDSVDRIIQGIIDARSKSGEDRGDLLSMLIFARDENGSRLSDRELRDEIMTLFFAGHETTSHALTWTWYLLGRHPEVAERLYAEVVGHLGTRQPNPDDLPHLPYLDMVIKESMRLWPSVWAYLRSPAHPVRLGDFTLSPETIILISPWVIHRSPRNFQAPLEFCPERFRSEEEKKIPRGAYVPFSMGPRVCVGKAFAVMETRIVGAMLIQRLHPGYNPGYVPQPCPQLALSSKNGLPITVRFRTADSVVQSPASHGGAATMVPGTVEAEGRRLS